MPKPPHRDAEYRDVLDEQVTFERARREARRLVDAEDRLAVELPEALTLAELIERGIEPVAYRVEGWQPEGSRVMLAAQYKAGKTTLVGNLARTLVDGGTFLGVDWVRPVAGAVALLDFEMSRNQVTSWLADQKIQNTAQVRVMPLRGAASAFDILDRDRRSEWAARVKSWGAAYVVLDCLRPILDGLGLDENHDAGRFLTAFDELLAEAGVPEALIVHHMGHTGERSRGDSRIRDWPDVEWRLVRQDPERADSPRFVSAYGRDVDVPETQLHYDPRSRHLTRVGGNRHDAKATAALGDVRTLLAAEPKLSGREIERRLRESSDHTQAVVRQAVRAGVSSGALTVESGPNGAHLHSLASPTQNPSALSALPARQRGGAECVSAYINAHSAAQLEGSTDPVIPTHSNWLGGRGEKAWVPVLPYAPPTTPPEGRDDGVGE